MDSDGDSTVDHEMTTRKKAHRNRRLASDTTSSDNDSSDNDSSVKPVDFDALKTDTPSVRLNNADAVTPASEAASEDDEKMEMDDPLSLPSIDETYEVPSDESNDAGNNPNQINQVNCDIENVSSDDDKDSEKTVSRLKLVPLETLLVEEKNTKPEKPKCPTVEVSSETSSDELLAELVKPKSTKKRTSKSRHTERNASHSTDDESNSDSSQHRKHKSRTHKSKSKQNQKHDLYSLKVKLFRLPENLQPLLKQYDLSEIRDNDQTIIVSRVKTQRYEKNSLKPNLKRTHNDGSNESSDDSDKLKKNPTKKQRLTDDCKPSTSKQSHSVEEKRSKRIQKQKPLRYNISSDSDDSNNSNKNNNDDDEDDEYVSDDDDNNKRKMRKKNVPKSSNDVTDSTDTSSNSEDEIEESNNEKSSDSEPTIRAKRKRQVTKKSSDDDDEDYQTKPAKHKRRKRIKKNSDSSDDDDKGTPKKHGRKNIRKVIRNADLEEETKEAAKREAERKKRIEERQKLYNEMYDNKLEEITELDKLVLDFDADTKEELLSVDKKLVKKLKPHQAQGIKFMWDACFETIEKVGENNGGGCILAHCMGLGKTLQVVTLVHTLLTHGDKTGVEKVLIICPVSTVLNWVNEFKIWLRHCSQNRNIEIFEISKYKQNAERAYRINEWHKEGGVLILGYDMFRNLSNEGNRIQKKIKTIFQEGLIDPGPDLVVCDEGHLLKNSKTSLSKAVNRIRTLRRIVLTGTPLQNNLNEYYCMVQFVKPNLLGKYNEYLNRFVNPITNGQYTDSTPYDIQMMKRRSHILHKLLDGCVQRRDYSVLAPFLPPKQEYVLYIRMTKLQVDLYKYYMANRPAQNEFGKTRSSILFQDFQNLQRIWTHPRVLRYNSDRYEQMVQKKKFMASDDEEGSLKDFIDDDEDDSDLDNTTSDSSDQSSNDSSVQSVHSDKPSNSKKPQQRRTRATAKDFEEEPIEPIKEENPTEWWMPLCPEEELNNIEYSGKLMLLFSILAECEACGDKLLVFSQSLFSLDVIEHFLAMIDENTQNPNPDAKLGSFSGSWTRGIDYFRLDGSTNIETRNANCNNFNSDENSQARLFLISTRAGGLGINLVAANRVIIFDASWNPSHDIQSIFRIYRFGQKKPCYIYRFIALGTMEEKIYERQVTKLAISKRVIDEHQIDRHYKENDLNELYNIENIDPEDDRPQPKLPKDRLFAEQLQKYPDRIWKYHEHDSLLENKSEETLSKEEIEAAWKEFEEEKNRPAVTAQTYVGYPTYQRAPGAGPVTSNNIFGFRTDILLQLLNIKARRSYPGTQNISDIVPMLLKHLYDTMEKNDTSFYQELLYIQQTEMAAPSQGSYLTPQGHIMPAYSGRGRPPLNPQHNQHMQQQHLIQQQQNRLMNLNNGSAPRLPAPTQASTQVIEID